MASILFSIFSTINEVYIIQERIRESSVFHTPFSFGRWAREVHRYRLQRDIAVYLSDPSGLITTKQSPTTNYKAGGAGASAAAETNASPGVISSAVKRMAPGVVYKCPLFKEAEEGLSFYIRGRVLKTCERFAIDLVLNNDKGDIALHFNPRLPQNYVVRNSKVNGTWGEEERCSALPFSLHRDSTFLIQILVTQKDYSISVNGHHFAHYRHRLPVHLVSEVCVSGDVADVSCEQNVIAEYPEPACDVKHILYVDDTNEVLSAEERNQFPVPYYGKLKLPFDTSHELHIHGRLKMLPDSFYVNLQNSSKIWPHPLIHFHFNPRFNSTSDGKHILCCNSWLEGDWGKEERTDITHPDFYPSRTFQLRFKRTYNSYLVYMNNTLINEFRFRDSGHQQPDTVYIQGDFVISEIYVSNSYEEYPIEEE